MKEMRQIEQNTSGLPEEVYHEALRIVKMLDEVYGADRDVDHSDGGFVLIVENVQDLGVVKRQYVGTDSNRHEVVSVVQCEKEPYLNVFYLCNNEFGINVFMPISIAPSFITDGLKNNKRS